MRKRILLFLSLVAIMVFPFTVHAEGDSYLQTESTNRTVDHSLFTAGDNLTSEETVDGINFVAGNNITVKGSNEYGFYAGNNINVSNSIDKDLFIAGNNIVIEKDVNIGRDLFAAGSNVSVSGNITNNAYIGGSTITLKDLTINGNLKVACEKINVEGVVTINGTLYMNEGVIINNENNLMVDTKETYTTDSTTVTKNVIFDILISMAALMVLGFIINSLFPKVYENLIKNFEFKKELKNIAFGLLGLILIPIISILLICTLIGMPLGFILLFVYIIMIIISSLYGVSICGNLILTKLFHASDNSYLSIAIGVIVLNLFKYIPVIGPLVYMLIIFYGIGKSIELFCNRNK